LTLNIKNAPQKYENQTLIEFTEYLTDWYTSKVPDLHRKQKGQYFTPGKISEFMIKQFQNLEKYDNINVLDPGAGLGIFESAFCDYFKILDKNIRIHFDLYENDAKVLPFLEYNMEICKRELESSGVEISYKIIPQDFLLSNSHICLNQEGISEKEEKKYDFVVSNPPYYKINTNSSQVQYMKHIMNGQPNIYPFFMALSAKLLKPEGQVSLLTPRSYCSGLYYKKFRSWFFEVVKPCKIHLFGSRKEIFGKYDVYQENMILTAIKTKNIPKKIQISVSKGVPTAKKDTQIRITSYNNIINKKHNEITVRIPTSRVEELIATHIDKYKDNLESLGFQASTGSVVPFRAKKFLDYELTDSKESVPLIWMQNIIDGSVTWPIHIANKSIKIKVTNESKKILTPNKNYIFIKRLSTKGGKRHINSASYFKDHFNVEFIGIENHVNYISKKEGELTENESQGIVALLNSITYNKYFRIGNGTTQVNVKEIKQIPLPPINLIKKLGDSILELKQKVGNIEDSIQEKMVVDVLGIDEKILISLDDN
jgi:adenine-specific DNA-methyltransferase